MTAYRTTASGVWGWGSWGPRTERCPPWAGSQASARARAGRATSSMTPPWIDPFGGFRRGPAHPLQEWGSKGAKHTPTQGDPQGGSDGKRTSHPHVGRSGHGELGTGSLRSGPGGRQEEEKEEAEDGFVRPVRTGR